MLRGAFKHIPHCPGQGEVAMAATVGHSIQSGAGKGSQRVQLRMAPVEDVPVA